MARVTHRGTVRAPARRAPGLPGWLLGLACGIAASLAPSMAVLAIVLLVPGLLVTITDTSERRSVGCAVLLFGGAAAASPMMALWNDGPRLDTALTTALEAIPLAWLVQAGGWLMAELGPLCVGLILDASARLETSRLEQAHRDCLSEWNFND